MNFPRRAADLPSGFWTADYVRDWPRFGRSNAQSAVHGRADGGDHREADRNPVAAVAKRHVISEQTICTWRKRFGGFQAKDVRRLKQLETENAWLKNLVAERDLEIEIMKEVAAKNW